MSQTEKINIGETLDLEFIFICCACTCCVDMQTPKINCVKTGVSAKIIAFASDPTSHADKQAVADGKRKARERVGV